MGAFFWEKSPSYRRINTVLVKKTIKSTCSNFYAPIIRRMVEKEYSVSPVHLSIHPVALAIYVQVFQAFAICFKFFRWRHPCPLDTFMVWTWFNHSLLISWLFYVLALYACIKPFLGGGRVVRRCCVSYITGASNWYWLTVGQGLLSL